MATDQSTKRRKAAAKSEAETAGGARARLSGNGHGTAAHQRSAAAHEARAPAAAAATHVLQHAVEQFLYRQAELLDGKRWQDYIDLFADGAHYWMPATPGQATAEGAPSIIYEDKRQMLARMRRVRRPGSASRQVAWGTNHLVSNVIVESANGKTGELVVRSRFQLTEFHGAAARHFGGSYVHRLARAADGFRITLQRVDIVNARGAADYTSPVWA